MTAADFDFFVSLADETYTHLEDLIVEKLCAILSKRVKIVYGIDQESIHSFLTDDFNSFVLDIQKEHIDDLLENFDSVNDMGIRLAQRLFDRLDFSTICPYQIKNMH